MIEEDISSFPPEERIKKLKELEKKRKKEITEAQKIIKDSEQELNEQRKWKEKVPIPQVARTLFKDLSAEEKEIIEAHKGIKGEPEEGVEEILAGEISGESLEEIASKQVEIPLEVRESEYVAILSERPMGDIYGEMKNIREDVEGKGYISREEERRIEYLASAVEQKVEDVETGKYSFTEDVARAASLTRQIGGTLMNAYHHGKDGGGMYRG